MGLRKRKCQEPREKLEARSQARPRRSRNYKCSVACCPCGKEEVLCKGIHMLCIELR